VSTSFPLALMGLEGALGNDWRGKIGEIRRAYFEQHRSIKEIVRTLSVSRATVRKPAEASSSFVRRACGTGGMSNRITCGPNATDFW